MEPTNRPGRPAHTTPLQTDEKKVVRPKAGGKTRTPAAPPPETDKPLLHTRKTGKVSSSKPPLKQEGSTRLPPPEHNRATLELMASAVLSETALPGTSDHFDTGAFLYGDGIQEINQIERMAEQLLRQYHPEQLPSLLTQLKTLDHGEPGKPRKGLKHSFFIRTALLQASENVPGQRWKRPTGPPFLHEPDSRKPACRRPLSHL